MERKNSIREPRITGVSLVAENILCLMVQQGVVRGGVQVPYVEEPGETLEVDHNIPSLIHIVKDGRRIGVKVEDRQLGTQRFPVEYITGEELDLTAADSTDTYWLGGVRPICVYRKTKPNDIVDLAHPADAEYTYHDFAYQHAIYLVFAQAFAPGAALTLDITPGVYEQAQRTLTLDPTQLMSEAVHVSQLGFRKDDPAKRAYLSQWMGLGGGVNYDHIRKFYLLNDANERVYEGSVRLQHTGDVEPIGGQEISAYCPIYELDFSDFRGEGTFRVMVPELGCSFPFVIDETASWLSGFYANMNALYCQRSGIVTGEPYSKFRRPRVYHPDDGRVVYHSNCSLFASGNGMNCYGTDFNNFGNLVRMGTDEVVENAWGGYFDACDWDRRIQHLRPTKLHIELYAMFPDFFAKTKLPIPESGNGIPDILNEALYNIEFYKRLQLPDGGIRGGIEAEEHPIFGQCGWQDSLKAYAYAPDFWSSYYYAATAAKVAKALRDINAEKAADYQKSAEAAFAYAELHYPAELAREGHKWTSRACAGAKLERGNAACELFALTYDAKYDEIYRSVRMPKVYETAFVYAQLPNGIGDEATKRICRQEIVEAAEKAVVHGEKLPYHLTTEDPATDSAHGWSRFCTIPRNTELIRAHYLTGDVRYLQAAIAAEDYTTGANSENYCFTTGVGVRYPVHMLHHDSRMTGQEPPVGITVCGPHDFNHPDDAIPKLLRADFMWPGAYAWPSFESYLDIYRHPCMTEYTVQGNIGPCAYQWGYFAARAAF